MGVQVTDLQFLRDQLLLRRHKLQSANHSHTASGELVQAETANLIQLLEQVDKALDRLELGRYGICEVCQGEVETERLLADPLTRVCLECLRPAEARALERDLELAASIQMGLLPKQDLSAGGWNVSYHYDPAGAVSGDYCDVVTHGADLYFMLGDVSGKGVAASMLMANLHAMFRALVPSGLPLHELLERANRIFCESTLPTQYATLICGKAMQDGEVEISNSGHLAPLHVSSSEIKQLESSTVPVGLFSDQKFAPMKISLSAGDILVLYTDGVTESLSPDGAEYGVDRLSRIIAECQARSSSGLVQHCISDVLAFRASAQKTDDQTLMVLRFDPVRQ
ncbi:MAG TPA: SpoIIE family protein phosphatase [Candidatus Angelobacter sp.]|nr:SpoIIE family protein phosphatase [Candidatus Angelobacter sp.]